ncbi:hypothetical protein BpHYR1_031224, partial [Brachionus plicatilis]
NILLYFYDSLFYRKFTHIFGIHFWNNHCLIQRNDFMCYLTTDGLSIAVELLIPSIRALARYRYTNK